MPASGLSRKLLAATALLPVPFALAAHAQRSDVAFLAGVAGPQSRTTAIAGSTITSGPVSPAVQVNYAAQMLSGPVDGYVEIPLVFVMRGSGQSITLGTTTRSGSGSPDVYFTPGARIHFLPRSWISPYVAAGFGIASFAPTPTIAPGSVVVPGNRENSAALGFGGGLDLRLTPVLSLRGDARDYYTGGNLGGVTGRNHGIFQGGFALRF